MPRSDAGDHTHRGCSGHSSNPGAFGPLGALASGTEKRTAITKALERDPHHPDFLYVQGKILQKQGKLDEALTAFLRTTLVNPKEADAFFEIGSIYQQRNDRPRALSAYKKALDLSPDDPDYRRALASISPAAASKP